MAQCFNCFDIISYARMTIELWLAFVAASAVMLVIPGPTIVTVISYSIVPGSRRRLFANTWLVTALNAKGIVFFVAFLPQFLNPAANVSNQLWILAITFVVMATLNATLYAVFAGSAAGLLRSRRAQRTFNLAGGSLLSAAGAWALLARRA